MYSAIADEPTKPMARTRGSVSSVSTASLSPLTTLSTPAGSPASTSSSASRMGTEGSRSDGLRTKALPQASAGANFHIGIMAGKLNGVMPATTPSGWRSESRSMPGPALSLNVALGVGEGLAVLGGQELGEAVELFLHELEELEQHPRASLRVGRGPGRLRRLRIGDGLIHLRFLGEADLGLHLAGIGVEHVAAAAGRASDVLAADEMADFAHACLPRTLGSRWRAVVSRVR